MKNSYCLNLRSIRDNFGLVEKIKKEGIDSLNSDNETFSEEDVGEKLDFVINSSEENELLAEKKVIDLEINRLGFYYN